MRNWLLHQLWKLPWARVNQVGSCSYAIRLDYRNWLIREISWDLIIETSLFFIHPNIKNWKPSAHLPSLFLSFKRFHPRKRSKIHCLQQHPWARQRHKIGLEQLNMGVSKIGVPQNGWFIMENSLKWMIWGYHYFRKHPHVLAVLVLQALTNWEGETNQSEPSKWKVWHGIADIP